MNVGLDEAGDRQPAIELLARRIGCDLARDLDDAAAGDTDVAQRFAPLEQARAGKDEIERHGHYAASLRPR